MNASTDRTPGRRSAVAGRRRPWFAHPALRWVGGTLGLLGGGSFALLVAAIGHCAAFGGRCPAPRPPLLEDDIFGGLVLGLSVLVTSVVLAIRPDRRGVSLVAILLPVGVLPLAYAITVASHRGAL
jgi:hypothetical protein